MNRITALAERQANLIARSRALREDVAKHWNTAERPITMIDGGLSAIGRWLRSPTGIGITVLLVTVLGRRRSLKLVRAGLSLMPVAWRLHSAFARRPT